jgi:tetratricopeptide (TPR) repeat protein
MGDLYRALGQGEQAREAYRKALAIAERLAQAEPERADYQVDLAVALGNLGTAGASPDQGCLGRALQILRTLDAQGRLMEEDKPKIPALEAMISPKGSGIPSPAPPARNYGGGRQTLHGS